MNPFSLQNENLNMATNPPVPNILKKININENKPVFKLDNKTKKELLNKHAKMLELQDIMEKQTKRNHFLKLNFQKHELIKQRRKIIERQKINENIFVLKDIRQEKQNVYNSNLLNLDLSINATHLKTLQEDDKNLNTSEIKKDVFLTKVKKKDISKDKEVNTSFNALNNSKLARLFQTEDLEKKMNLHKKVKEDELNCLYKKMKKIYKNEDEHIYNNLSFVAFQVNNVEPTKDLYNIDKKRYLELKKRQKIEFLAKLSSNYDNQSNSKLKNYSKINIINKRKCLEDKIKLKKEIIEMEVTKTYLNNINQINEKSKLNHNKEMNNIEELFEVNKNDKTNSKDVDSELHTISFKNEILNKQNENLEYKKILPKIIQTKSYTPFEKKNNIFRNDSLANSLNYYKKYPDSKINNIVFRKIRSSSESERNHGVKFETFKEKEKSKQNKRKKSKSNNIINKDFSSLKIDLQIDKSVERKCMTPGKKITLTGKLAELKYLIITSNQKGEAYSMKYNIDKFMKKNKISKEIARKILGNELCDTFL